VDTNVDRGDRTESPEEWWWVVEWSDYMMKQYPGCPRYSVVGSHRLNEYHDIQCIVRYSSEAAAIAAADRGGNLLDAWEVIRLPAGSAHSPVGTLRYEAVPARDIQSYWAAGVRSIAAGLSYADAITEASRRSSLPQRWCVIPNDIAQTREKEPYTVMPAEDLSGYQEAHIRGTYSSEPEAWQAIPKIQAEDEQKYEKYEENLRRESEREQRRRTWLRRGVVVIGLVAALTASMLHPSVIFYVAAIGVAVWAWREILTR